MMINPPFQRKIWKNRVRFHHIYIYTDCKKNSLMGQVCYPGIYKARVELRRDYCYCKVCSEISQSSTLPYLPHQKRCCMLYMYCFVFCRLLRCDHKHENVNLSTVVPVLAVRLVFSRVMLDDVIFVDVNSSILPRLKRCNQFSLAISLHRVASFQFRSRNTLQQLVQSS